MPSPRVHSLRTRKVQVDRQANRRRATEARAEPGRGAPSTVGREKTRWFDVVPYQKTKPAVRPREQLEALHHTDATPVIEHVAELLETQKDDPFVVAVYRELAEFPRPTPAEYPDWLRAAVYNAFASILRTRQLHPALVE